MAGNDGMDAKAFLQSRSSCRMFQPGKIDSGLLTSLVELAQSAPSQCNRQSSRVHVYQDRAVIAQLLELQGGSRGFAQSVDNLFVVTSEVTAWAAPASATSCTLTARCFPWACCSPAMPMAWGLPAEPGDPEYGGKKIRDVGASRPASG
jgi:nitroreductase